MTIAAIVAIASVINAVLPAVGRASNALVSASSVADDRISSRIEIIHATGQDAATQADAWVKNTGASQIAALDQMDLFFGPETDFQRVAYGGAGCSAPCWDYEIENDSSWNPTATLHIIVYLDVADALVAGTTYYVKVVAPNGIEDSKFFTL